MFIEKKLLLYKAVTYALRKNHSFTIQKKL